MKSRNTLIFFLGGTLLLGFLSGLLSMNSAETYAAFIRPPLSPPGILFPIVWTVLYLLMGMSAFLVYESKSSGSSQALLVYAIQLGINLFPPASLSVFFHLALIAFVFCDINDRSVLRHLTAGRLSADPLHPLDHLCRISQPWRLHTQ